MTPHELALKCKQSIENAHGMRRVVLKLPGHARGEFTRLDRSTRRKCPMGRVIGHIYGPPAVTLADFCAIEVLAWLAAKGLVDVRCEGQEDE